jgi:hypothetical protein
MATRQPKLGTGLEHEGARQLTAVTGQAANLIRVAGGGGGPSRAGAGSCETDGDGRAPSGELLEAS